MQSTSPRSTSRAAAEPQPLRLFEAAAPNSAGHLSARMTLGQFYRAFYRPVCLESRGAAQRNLDQYDQSVHYWVALTDDPPLEAIDDFTVARSLSGVTQLPGRKPGTTISPNTIRKHCTHLQAVLDRTGPRSREARFRKAQGLLELVPYIEKPPARKKEASDSFTVAEIEGILAACHAAAAPTYLDRARRTIWWQALVLFAYNTGLRLGSLVIVRWDALEVDADGSWWASVRVKGGDTRRVHCNRFAMQAVESMRPLSGRFDCIWHFPHVQSWLQENRRRILLASGLPPDRHFGFHGLRKAHATEASRIDAVAASLQLGHKDWSTTQNAYIHPNRMKDGAAKLPQPKMPTRQKRLFD